MQILFAISILCFFALVWAGVAIATHIRASHKVDRTSPEQRFDFVHHLFAATERTGTRPSFAVSRQRVQDILANKSWSQPPTVVTVRPDFDLRAAESIQGRRTAQQTSQPGAWERLDWAYFNKDSGDLTDPYEARRRRAYPSDQTTSRERF